MSGRHLTVNVISVVRAVTGEGRDGTPDLVVRRDDHRRLAKTQFFPAKALRDALTHTPAKKVANAA